MKYRLDAQHYINDRLLEPGHIIGDGTDVPFTDKKGRPMKPSVSMTPMDDEARSFFKHVFPGAELPERDALKAIPIKMNEDGTVRQPNNQGPVETGGPGAWVIGPDDELTNELKKGLPDSGSPNSPVGKPVIGTPSAPGTTPSVPVESADDKGQPPGAPLKGQQGQPRPPEPPKPAQPVKKD